MSSLSNHPFMLAAGRLQPTLEKESKKFPFSDGEKPEVIFVESQTIADSQFKPIESYVEERETSVATKPFPPELLKLMKTNFIYEVLHSVNEKKNNILEQTLKEWWVFLDESQVDVIPQAQMKMGLVLILSRLSLTYALPNQEMQKGDFLSIGNSRTKSELIEHRISDIIHNNEAIDTSSSIFFVQFCKYFVSIFRAFLNNVTDEEYSQYFLNTAADELGRGEQTILRSRVSAQPKLYKQAQLFGNDERSKKINYKNVISIAASNVLNRLKMPSFEDDEVTPQKASPIVLSLWRFFMVLVYPFVLCYRFLVSIVRELSKVCSNLRSMLIMVGLLTLGVAFFVIFIFIYYLPMINMILYLVGVPHDSKIHYLEGILPFIYSMVLLFQFVSYSEGESRVSSVMMDRDKLFRNAQLSTMNILVTFFGKKARDKINADWNGDNSTATETTSSASTTTTHDTKTESKSESSLRMESKSDTKVEEKKESREGRDSGRGPGEDHPDRSTIDIIVEPVDSKKADDTEERNLSKYGIKAPGLWDRIFPDEQSKIVRISTWEAILSLIFALVHGFVPGFYRIYKGYAFGGVTVAEQVVCTVYLLSSIIYIFYFNINLKILSRFYEVQAFYLNQVTNLTNAYEASSNGLIGYLDLAIGQNVEAFVLLREEALSYLVLNSSFKVMKILVAPIFILIMFLAILVVIRVTFMHLPLDLAIVIAVSHFVSLSAFLLGMIVLAAECNETIERHHSLLEETKFRLARYESEPTREELKMLKDRFYFQKKKKQDVFTSVFLGTNEPLVSPKVEVSVEQHPSSSSSSSSSSSTSSSSSSASPLVNAKSKKTEMVFDDSDNEDDNSLVDEKEMGAHLQKHRMYEHCLHKTSLLIDACTYRSRNLPQIRIFGILVTNAVLVHYVLMGVSALVAAFANAVGWNF